MPIDPSRLEPTGAVESGGGAVSWADAVVETEDGSRTFASARYGETYRSIRGAHAEARHVFVEGTGVGQRLAGGVSTRVVEVGLGAATNFAWTAAAALSGGGTLQYEVWETAPLPAEAWAELGLDAVVPAPFLAALLAGRAAWGELETGSVRSWRHGPVRLDLVVAPIAWLPTAMERGWAALRLLDPGGALDTDRPADAGADAVYLDPFSPAVNPDAWAPAVLAALARRLRPGGALASYTVAGHVRRALAAAGLEVAKVPGPPGGKREVLLARRPDPAAGATGAGGGA